ncbi:MAG: PEP-CTERM sorting domain-containing protein [Sedimentisphaerales bacterium]|nr:PEP-CTERM sorting domain-containing protein [Sedimentisphaerales bacterium]
MKNKNIKKFNWFVLLTVLLSLQATAKAGYYLPESSLWQGARFYNENNVDAYVEYAVYDTASATYHDTLDGLIDGFANPGSGQYIYAYQAINLGSSLPPIATFELLGGNPSAADGIGSLDDGYGGLIPTNDGVSFLWRFDNGVFVANEHSAFMIFSSNSGPVAGSFKLSTLDEYGDEPPIDNLQTDVPEPATVALLAAGAWAIIIRKKDQK